MATKIPTTVFSGFLGSGKTTIISHLVDELQKNNIQVVYIKNEIGDENVDGQILNGQHITTKELLNGCICCTLVGPFILAIDEVIQSFHPDRIIIEASGAADPAAIALMIESHPGLERDGVVSVIDVVNFQGYIDLSLTAQNQTKFTDLLVFNKVEQVDLDRKRAVVGYVRELNNHSPIVEALKGKLSLNVVFGVSTVDLDQLLTQINDEDDHTDPHHQDHLAVDGITSFHLQTQGRCTEEDLKRFLGDTPRSVYRIKGFVHLDDGTLVIANKVGTRISLEPAPATFLAEHNSLVFIGFSILDTQADLANKLQQLFKE